MMPRRLLAIRLRALGDVVLTTPALRALRRGYPDAALELVTDPSYAPLFEADSSIDRVWSLERSHRATLALILRLRQRRYDLVVDFFGNPRSALISAACGAWWSAGYALRGRAYAYHLRVPRVVSTADGLPEYAAATHLRLARAVGGIEDGLEPRLMLSERAEAEATHALGVAGVEDPGRAVGLVPAGTWATKTWPLSHFTVLARRLLDAGRVVVAIIGPGEEHAAATLKRLVPEMLFLRAADVAVLAAAVARLGAVVGTDSGPRHMAVAFGVPTFAWFGPGDPGIWTPRDPRHGVWWTELPCRGCNRTVCPHWNCLPGLTPDRASEAVLQHLEHHVAPALGTAARA